MGSTNEEVPPERRQAALGLLELQGGDTRFADKGLFAHDLDVRKTSAAQLNIAVAPSVEVIGYHANSANPSMPLEVQGAADILCGLSSTNRPLPVNNIAMSTIVSEGLEDKSSASGTRDPFKTPTVIAGMKAPSQARASSSTQVDSVVNAIPDASAMNSALPALANVGGFAGDAMDEIQPGPIIPMSMVTAVAAGSAASSASLTPGAAATRRKEYKKRLTCRGDPECPFAGEPVNGRIHHKQVGWVADPSMFSVPLCGIKRNERNCTCMNRNCREIRTIRAMHAVRVERMPLRDVEALWHVARSTVHQRLLLLANKDKMHIYNLLN